VLLGPTLIGDNLSISRFRIGLQSCTKQNKPTSSIISAMSSAAVTPQMRAHGWNVYFLADTEEFHFSGIFQSPEDGFLTFRDVVDELRLCFELPDAVRYDDSQTQEKDPWNDIAFGLVTRDTSLSDSPRLATDEHRDMQVPSLAGPEAQERAVIRYHVRHSSPCNLPSDAPLSAHLKG
jgi:hypothetical protein